MPKKQSEAQDFIDSTSGMDPHARVEALKNQVQIKLHEQKLLLMESFALQFGGSATSLDLNLEDPRNDDGEPWNEIGLGGSVGPGVSMGLPLLRTERDLQRARNIGRALAAENEYAIGAQKNRQSYIVGTGLLWRAEYTGLGNEDRSLTQQVNASIQAFLKQEKFHEVERNNVWRADRDGETFLRAFSNADGPMRVRFWEPEHVKAPVAPRADSSVDPFGSRISFGVEVGGDQTFIDVMDVVAFHLTAFNETIRVQRVDARTKLPQMFHFKLNVDMNARRGWPTMWPIRRNLARAEKLQRNMSYVAALQAAIALIRKHEAATRSEVESFLDANRDLSVTNRATGKETRYTGLQPGTIIDSGPGISYEAPVSSVDASSNVSVHAMELRSCAAALVMPEYMFSADSSNANFSSTLVAETPAVKNFEYLQSKHGEFLQQIVETAVAHEVFWRRLPAEVLDDYDVKATFPELIVRNSLQETQKRQIENLGGVLSVTTWRDKAGYDNETEVRNLAIEGAVSDSAPEETVNAAAGGIAAQAGSNTARAETADEASGSIGGAE